MVVGKRFVVVGALVALAASVAAQPRAGHSDSPTGAHALGQTFTLRAPSRPVMSVMQGWRRSTAERTRKAASRSRLEAQVLRQINTLRARRSLRPLRFSSRLNSAADSH